MKISIQSMTLASLLSGYFSYEACEVIETRLEELEADCGESYRVPTLGDIIVSFSEVKQDTVDEDDENIVAHLSNGNVLILN